jgi:choline-sulfatase
VAALPRSWPSVCTRLVPGCDDLHVPRPPNFLLLITDQQRSPMHWPNRPGWLRELMPSHAELARTGLAFTRAFANSCMCSPSRATLFTGRMPAEHGVVLTHTRGGARPTPRNLLATARAGAGRSVRDGVPAITGIRALSRMALRAATGTPQRAEPELRPQMPNLATLLRDAGYEVAYKGKWHLTKPVAGGRWSDADTRHLAERFGVAGWEPPDAGEDTAPEHFGAGAAGRTCAGWDEDFTRQAERFLTDRGLPEPFALVVSLVNPHDVLAYPMTWRRGGFTPDAVRDLGVRLPPTVDERLNRKPVAHGVQKYGQQSYLGPLPSHQAKLEYVNFYAHLHSVVDEKIGRVLAALGDPADPRSLRSRTVIVRTSDHGELGLSHGGMRQKMFNAYEETIRVPLVVSNPVLFPRGVETDALAALVDVVPTMLSLAGGTNGARRLDGEDLLPVLALHAAPEREAISLVPVDLQPVLRDTRTAASVRDAISFTYDDDAAGTFLKDTVPPPNHIRCVRERRLKYAVYVDPSGRAEPHYELYDLERDPVETENLVDRDTGQVHDATYASALDRLRERVAAVPAPG